MERICSQSKFFTLRDASAGKGIHLTGKQILFCSSNLPYKNDG